jgi:hypothetical protein
MQLCFARHSLLMITVVAATCLVADDVAHAAEDACANLPHTSANSEALLASSCCSCCRYFTHLCFFTSLLFTFFLWSCASSPCRRCFGLPSPPSCVSDSLFVINIITACDSTGCGRHRAPLPADSACPSWRRSNRSSRSSRSRRRRSVLLLPLLLPSHYHHSRRHPLLQQPHRRPDVRGTLSYAIRQNPPYGSRGRHTARFRIAYAAKLELELAHSSDRQTELGQSHSSSVGPGHQLGRYHMSLVIRAIFKHLGAVSGYPTLLDCTSLKVSSEYRVGPCGYRHAVSAVANMTLMSA